MSMKKTNLTKSDPKKPTLKRADSSHPDDLEAIPRYRLQFKL